MHQTDGDARVTHPTAVFASWQAVSGLLYKYPQVGRFLHARWQQLMGKIYMDRGDYPTALSFFRKTIEQPAPRYAWVTAWAWTRTGMIHDLLGERAGAQQSYRMALAVETDGIAKKLARYYLNEPYRKETARRTAPATGPEENTESP